MLQIDVKITRRAVSRHNHVFHCTNVNLGDIISANILISIYVKEEYLMDMRIYCVYYIFLMSVRLTEVSYKQIIAKMSCAE